MEFIDRLDELIAKSGKNKNQIAKDLGLTKNYYVNWKNRGNVPDGETLNLLSKYFGVSVDYLLTGENKKSSSKTADEWYNRFSSLNEAHRAQIEEMMRAYELAEKMPPENSDG